MDEQLHQEDGGQLLRQHQIEELEGEHETLEKKLKDPGVQDKGSVLRQMRALEGQLNRHRPKPPVNGEEQDRLVRLESELREQWLEGMPSQEEMRKNPPGAVDKHRMWEKRNKPKLLRWKNVMLRLNVGSPERDIANHEKFRPRVSTLNMHNAQIAGQQFYFPSGDIPIRNVMSDADRTALKAETAGIGLASATKASPKSKKKVRASEWSDERRQAAREQARARWAKAKAAAPT